MVIINKQVRETTVKIQDLRFGSDSTCHESQSESHEGGSKEPVTTAAFPLAWAVSDVTPHG